MIGALGGRYDLTALLGSGEHGRVWRARDRGTDREVAVKMMHPELASDTRLIDRFQRARGLLGGLWHPGIARLLDVVAQDGELALVTELGPGTDLGHRLSRGPLSVTQAAQCAAVVADALATAHRLGVVHGDLKPSNVLIGPAAVTDFSVALFARAGRHRAIESPYIAPDEIDGAVPASSGDVYALGVLLRQMVDPDARHAAAPDLLEIGRQCMRPDPGDRPDAATVYAGLTSLFPEAEVTTGRPSHTPRHEASDPQWQRIPTGEHRAPALAAQPGRSTRRRGDSRNARSRSRWGWVAAGIAIVLALAVGIAVLIRETPDTATVAPPPQLSTGPAEMPSLPPAATVSTAEGGMAFIQYWFALLNYATHTGDVASLRTATNPGCTQCGPALQVIESAYGEGGSFNGGAYVVRRIATSSLWSAERPVYDVTVDRAVRNRLDTNGGTQNTLGGLAFFNCVVVLERTGDAWRLLDVNTPGCVA